MLNATLNWNFGDAIEVQDLSGIHVWNFVRCYPQPKQFWRRPWFSSCYYNFSRWSYWHFCIQFCSSVKFYSVIFCIFSGILNCISQKEVDQIEFFKIRYSTRMCESRSWPTRIASQDTSNSFVFFRAQARSLYWPRTHRKEKNGRGERSSAWNYM